ncbi:MAG: methyltransferase domain-containing protein [Bacteroidetes bacterium]|nr:methyltransferase domain-containing protein [Bacteroidota bacterium]
MSESSLNDNIRDFYDQSTHLWLDTWGEHMHHGYYGPDGKEKKDRRQAQIDLIEKLLDWGDTRSATQILDAGCGVGGSARYLAARFKARVLGMTLSPVQAEEGALYNRKAGLEDQVQIEVRDMMRVQKADGPFDLIWSMESAEHIADKQQLFERFSDVLAPGGSLLMATWCHRKPIPTLSRKEQKLLAKLYRIYNLPPMVDGEQLASFAEAAGLKSVLQEDWSDAVAPFWQEVIRSALELRNFSLLLKTGWAVLEGAWAMRYMRKGYKMGLIRFVVLQAKKTDA